ncbi:MULTISPECIES: bile acid:sodium symporter family protein [unclassified Shewanella]|uniref:bile acid:sodium symporter family protein n=1 Tax=unclassified Shewanella TaxID=196818 RepID=UPI000C82EFE2|nr:MULTISPECIES: bile acid:sodium symporter family protein [unclassified Shewanella]MDO6618256.1 bile acid:sodium symporter family protein [Shewanella sp. 6_MG-2023]MDO6641632.1 bile acid:sodium symporter family protein [Shewanella sp. 5_MG-2023]MDO6679973.1 bile acid:sodium symporter family protein [Shewanella sp. 4_MG-2023]MDO6775664.1 bile acid:sodium symporter family protein [Shewanella sp. 3_MG-2023]PMG39928.1 bile acid:sodium symporter [Shewanella sp. 10N.286.52.B9]
MESIELVKFVNTKVIPICIFLIMMGMGLSLIPKDFKRVVKYPKAVSIGLVNQLILLPLIGFVLASVMPLEPEYAVGVMLLVLCPGGTTSNMFTHLAKGDVALSVSMTAIASIITVFTIPVILNLSLEHFMGKGTEFSLPIITTMISLMKLTILPIGIGMLIKRFAPKLADSTQVHVSKFGILFLTLLIIFLTYIQKDIVVSALIAAGPVSILLNISTMALGYYSSKWLGLNLAQRTSITIEVGLQNSTLSMFMALTLLANYKMSFTPAIYTLTMLFTAGVLVRIFNSKFNRADKPKVQLDIAK